MDYSFVPKNCLDANTQKTVQDLTYLELNDVVNSSYLSVIKFYANWCLDCSIVAPYYEKLPLQPKFKNVRFYSMNANVNDDTVVQCNVCTLPTFQFYYKGQKLCSIAGADINAVTEKLHELLTKYNL